METKSNATYVNHLNTLHQKCSDRGNAQDANDHSI